MAAACDVDPTIELAHNNKTYVLKRPDFYVEGQFVDWVRRRAKDEAENSPNPIMRKEDRAGINGEIAAGYYDWEVGYQEKNYVQEARWSGKGLARWAFLCLHRYTPWMISLEAKEYFLGTSRLDPIELQMRKRGTPSTTGAWDDLEFRNRVLEALQEIESPNAQTPPAPTTSPGAASATPSKETTA